MTKTPLPETKLLSRAGFASIVLIFLAGNGMILGYMATRIEVSLVINDRSYAARTHQTTVGALLDELEIPLSEEDIVFPPLDEPLTDLGQVVIQKAQPIALQADGRRMELYTHSRTVLELLREAGVSFGRHDRVLVEGEEVSLNYSLVANNTIDVSDAAPSALWHQPALRIQILRAVPITVRDGSVPMTVQTTASTVAQALYEEGILLYLGDGVTPSLGTQISAGVQIYIQRSKPVVILADGRRIKARTHAQTLEEVLREESIELVGKDYTTPDLEAEVYDNMVVQVTRVQEQVVLEEEPIPFETVWQPDGELELDKQRLDQSGFAGAKRRLVRIVYENGVETERVTEDEWVETPPTTETIAYGTKIVIRELQTAEGPISYWRHFRAYATAYTASTAGTPRDAPWYGRTYMGLPARKGIIAVDPQVISFGTWMYVPGYGKGLAADRGVYGKHIDLCYDDDKWPPPWHWFVDVYLLTPVPPAERIRWILPSYPRER
ncbi:MAG: ubiquitin-like domain-containing protein [Anaerolineae bacterium]|nr:ubiquitin-like domain-containing protein [Anaerolineae bacterium]